MTHPDPDEQERDGAASPSRSHDSRSHHGAGDDPEDIRAAFDRIVAGLQAELEQPRLPPCDTASPPAGELDVDPAGDLVRDSGEGHFDPPEPPPFPTPRPRTVGGVLALAAGVLLLAWPSLLGPGERLALPLALLALTAGIGWLVIGLRPDPPSDESDDGARL